MTQIPFARRRSGVGFLPALLPLFEAAAPAIAAKFGADAQGKAASDEADAQFDAMRLQQKLSLQQQRMQAKKTKSLLPYYLIGGAVVLGLGVWLLVRKKGGSRVR